MKEKHHDSHNGEIDSMEEEQLEEKTVEKSLGSEESGDLHDGSSSNEEELEASGDQKLQKGLVYAETELPDRFEGAQKRLLGICRFLLPSTFFLVTGLLILLFLRSRADGVAVLLPLEAEMTDMNIPFEYRHLRGKITEKRFDSGMTWLHISDDKLPTAGCSIQVKAGMFDEVRTPRFYEGTAHLLEHSVFLRQTPKDKEMYTFWNAFTSSKETQYILAATYQNFHTALAMTSHELFNFEEIQKTLEEVTAVNSE